MSVRYSRFVTTAICVSLLFAVDVPAVFSQKTKGLIVEGVSFEKVLIGKTTMQEVKASYGKNYETSENGEYSVVIRYKSLGLSFYACKQDPKREIFDITFEAPAKVRTSKGIVLGKSTLADVFRLYKGWGERTYSDSDQTGIYFFVIEDSLGSGPYEALKPEAGSAEETVHKKKIVKSIELVEKKGSRQCDAMFGSESNQ